MNESSYTPLQRKGWRGITYDWEALQAQGDKARLYCLTDFQVAWLLSNCEYFRWQTRWKNLDVGQQQLDQQKAELEYRLMDCLDFDLDQLQYIYDATQQAQADRYNDLYTAGGIAGLNPNTPTDYYSGDGSVQRLDALCMACDTYVRSFLSNWLQAARLISPLLTFTGLLVGFVPYIGKIAAFALNALSLVAQVAVNAVEDNAAVEAVICCMYNGLVAGAVDQATFENCLDGCGFTVGSNEAIVRDLVAADLVGFNNWLSFLNALGNSYLYMLAGVDYTCPCAVDVPFCVIYNFSFPDGVVNRSCGTPSGNQLATNDVFCEGAYYAMMDVSIPDTVLTHVQATMTVTGNNPLARVVFTVYFTDSTFYLEQWNPAAAGTYNPSWTNVAGKQVERLYIYIRNGTIGNPPTADTGLISDVQIEGINNDVFFNANPCP